MVMAVEAPVDRQMQIEPRHQHPITPPSEQQIAEFLKNKAS